MNESRTAVAIGLVFVVIGAIYVLVSHDVGGATMLGALGLAMGVMVYVLATGSAQP